MYNLFKSEWSIFKMISFIRFKQNVELIHVFRYRLFGIFYKDMKLFTRSTSEADILTSSVEYRVHL